MSTFAKLCMSIRNLNPLTILLLLWLLLCVLANSWRNGTLALLFFLTASGAILFKRWRRRRIALHIDEQIERPGELRLVWSFIVELVRRSALRYKWPRACAALKLLGPTLPPRAPSLRSIDATISGDLVATVSPGAVLADVDEYVARAQKFSGLLRWGTYEVVITPTTPGDAKIEVAYGDPFRKVLPLSKLVPPAGPHHMVYGMRRNKSTAELNYLQSVLIGGLTRRGKSVAGKAFLASLMAQNVPVALYIADLKDGQEFGEFSQLGRLGDSSVEVAGYATTVKDVEAMLAKMNRRSVARVKVMQQHGLKQWHPTPDEPLLVGWLDETLPLSGKLGVSTDVGEIAYKGSGRAAVLWVNSQLGEKEVLGKLRDLIPQRISFATVTYQQTDMILGDSAHLAGALCHRLGETQGVGYSGSDGDHVFVKFRAFHVTERDAANLAKGRLPQRAVAKPADDTVRHWLYRAHDDRPAWAAQYGERLPYIGRTSSVDRDRRIRQHERFDWKFCKMHGRWENYWRVHVTRVEWTELPTLDRLKLEEQHAIETELPVFNVVHNRGPLFGRRMRARFARRAAGHPRARRQPSTPRTQYDWQGAE